MAPTSITRCDSLGINIIVNKYATSIKKTDGKNISILSGTLLFPWKILNLVNQIHMSEEVRTATRVQIERI